MPAAAHDLSTWGLVLAALLALLLVLALWRLRRVAALEREVDELRRLQRAREQDAARLRFFFEHSRDGVFVIDQEARVVEANDSFARMIGRSPDELGRLHVWDFDLDYPRERAIDAVNRSAPELQSFGSRWRGPGGVTLHVDISINRVVFQGRRLILGVARDVSERWRIEAEIGRHREHLAELVAERTRELGLAVRAHADSELRLQALNEQLVNARDRAEAASRAKSAFLANMSHEIRTPMNAIIGLTHLMQREPRTSADAERLAKVSEAAHHLLVVINDVLDLSKIESGKLQLESTTFELAPLLQRCLALVAERARAKGLALDTRLGQQVPARLAGDPTRLSQALLNLLDNAVKFTERGQVRLQCELQQADAGRVKLHFEVADTGPGIDADKLPQLFNPFEQGDSSTTRRFGGTGLGLAITRRLAQLMDGETGAESRPGEGSRFWFTAWFGEPEPAVAAAVALAVPPAVPGRSDFGGRRVLLAEDNRINQEVAVELLHAAGMDVDVADDGKAAVALAERRAYDLVLMDVQMPRLDGLEATRRIRALPAHAHTPIIAMTANAFGDDRSACLAAGMNDHIGKPVDPQRMYEAIGRWITAAGPLAAAVAGASAAPAVSTAASSPAAPAPAPAPAAPASAGNAPADTSPALPPIEGLVPTRALTWLPGRDEIYRRVLARFAESHGEGDPPLAALARASDWPALRAAVHALRGSCGAIGAVDLAAQALALEQAIDQPGGDAERRALAERLDHALRALARRISAALHSGAGAAPAPAAEAAPATDQ